MNITSLFLNIILSPTDTFLPIFMNIMPMFPNITPNPANAFGSISTIYQPTVTFRPAQIGLISSICQETIISHLTNALGSTPLICQSTITFGPI